LDLFKASTFFVGIHFHKTTGMLLHKTVTWWTKTDIRYEISTLKLV